MPKQPKRPVLAWRWFLLSIVVLLAVFIPAFRLQRAKIEEQQARMLELEAQRYEVVMAGERIKDQMQDAGTAGFIEQQARQQFGYMMPGEVRYYVDNLPVPGAAPIVVEQQAPAQSAPTTAAPQETPVPAQPQTGVVGQEDWSNFSD